MSRPGPGLGNALPRVPADGDGYPRFSNAEMERRRTIILASMQEAGIEHLIVYGANRFGPAIQWLCGWPTTTESMLVLGKEMSDVLLVQFRNHVPNARVIAPGLDVRWGGTSSVDTLIDELRRRGARGPIGVIGPVPYTMYGSLVAAFGGVVDLGEHYVRTRLVKSEEELAWVRVGVELTDRAIDSLRDYARAGLDVNHLADLVERAYVRAGGANQIHFFGVTSMDAPDISVPAQWPSTRRLEPGDVIVTEISASYWGYPGQVLRTFAVEADPPPLYLELHRVAEAAFDAIVDILRPGAHAREVVEAAAVINQAGFTTYDDLLHGFVGGYLPPVLGIGSGTVRAVPDFTFQPGMTVVVQPNVITPDERAGVQVGELILITDTGVERLHRSERGFRRIG